MGGSQSIVRDDRHVFQALNALPPPVQDGALTLALPYARPRPSERPPVRPPPPSSAGAPARAPPLAPRCARPCDHPRLCARLPRGARPRAQACSGCRLERGRGAARVKNWAGGSRPCTHPVILDRLVPLLLYVSEEHNCYLEGRIQPILDHVTG